jgi:hypothetical protein
LTLSIIASSSPLGITTTVNTTTYQSFGGRLANSSTESFVQTTMQDAGTFQNMYWRVSSNAITGGASTVNFRDNAGGTATTQTFPIAAGSTGEFEDILHSDTITAGHKYNFQFVPGDTTHTLVFLITRVLFNATTDTVTRLASDDGNAYTAANTTYYWSTQTTCNLNTTTEAGAKCRQRLAGTAKNLMINVSAYTRTDTNTVKSRLNGADGALVVTLTGTGFFEDTTHSDTIAVGDDYCFAMTTGIDSTHTMTLRQHAYSFISTSGYTYCANTYAGGFAPASASTKFYPIAGSMIQNTATEASTNMKSSEAKMFKELTVLVSANSTGASTFRFRKNSANGNQVVPVSASSTGVFSDSVNYDSVLSTDEINYLYTPGAASGVTINSMSTWGVGLTRIVNPDTLKYNIRKQITKNNTLKYNIRKLITNSNTLKYNIRKLITHSNILKYNLRKLVLSSRILKYNLRKLIVSSRIVKYNLRKLVISSRILKYNIRLAVKASRVLKYSIRKQVTHQNVLKYNLRMQVKLSNTLLYNINDKLRVIHSNVLKYNIRQQVKHQNSIKYNIRKQVVSFRALRYNLRIKVAAAQTLRYNLRKLVKQNRTLKYNIRKSVTKSQTLQYRIRQQVKRSQTLKYSILGYITRVTRRITLIYEIMPVYWLMPRFDRVLETLIRSNYSDDSGVINPPNHLISWGREWGDVGVNTRTTIKCEQMPTKLTQLDPPQKMRLESTPVKIKVMHRDYQTKTFRPAMLENIENYLIAMIWTNANSQQLKDLGLNHMLPQSYNYIETNLDGIFELDIIVNLFFFRHFPP